jgi:hypothetical protein
MTHPPKLSRGTATTWAAGTALLAACVAIVIGTAAVGATQLANSPIATAQTATPGPVPAPPPMRVTAQAAAPSQAKSPANWVSRAGPPFTDIHVAAKALVATMSAQDVGGMTTSCQQLHNAGQRLGATLPSPNAAVTSEVQGAVDNISAATNSCDALGSGGVDLNQVNSYVGQAMGQMDKALQILQGNG